ncbi:hypothetical protein BDF19DRAFT_425661 [Syncephalis fuscata]|nr:hypothetical protein BDF19DRAFT_425661 [Syncephalis fuscata]
MLCLVNRERAQRGLRSLGLNHKLDNAAYRHKGSNGSSPSERASDVGYDWSRVAENVAYGYDNEGQCMRHWMRSSGHRRNILGDYVHFGSAVAYSRNGTPYYTQEFGHDGQKQRSYPLCPDDD